MLTCEISNSDLDFMAYLVIDSTVLGKCSGGVRMSTEVTIDEVKSLARNMTLKYGFLQIPMGGAKLGIRINKFPSAAKRKEIFIQLGKSLQPLITRGCFYPWVDMGTSWRDINILKYTATNQNVNWQYFPTHEYTSWTMLASLQEALEMKGLRFNQVTVAVQGFGKVGSSAAKAFSEKGARIVAVSTLKGSIYNSQGFDVERLLIYREKFGDAFVNKAPLDCSQIGEEDLLYLPVDILVLCAGPWQINSQNSHKVQAEIICPGANIGITREAEEQLYHRGVLVLPDFISNCGGVLGSHIGNDSLTKKIVNGWFKGQVKQILNISSEKGIAPFVIAEKLALSRFEKIKARYERSWERKMYQWLVDEFIPRMYRKVFMKLKLRKLELGLSFQLESD
jgi:glutamate dehydrogenase/leucine dehydrogenase